jgi:hypothetical protein
VVSSALTLCPLCQCYLPCEPEALRWGDVLINDQRTSLRVDLDFDIQGPLDWKKKAPAIVGSVSDGLDALSAEIAYIVHDRGSSLAERCHHYI